MAQTSDLKLIRLDIHTEDLEFSFVLRNSNREFFFDSKPLTYLQHLAWHKRKLDDPFFGFFIIWKGNHRVGTIALEHRPECTFLQNLCIHKDYRGQGIAKWAIKQLMRKNRFIVAQVKPDNVNVIKMYEELGFWKVT